MRIKKKKMVSDTGRPYTFFVVLEAGDPHKCEKCGEPFRVKDLVCLERKTVYPKSSLADIDFKFTRKIFCHKCQTETNTMGLMALVFAIENTETEAGEHDPESAPAPKV